MAMEMRGSLNLSTFYKRADQPKYYGRALINGVEYDIKGWEKDGLKGKWVSLLFEDPADKQKQREDEFAPAPKEKPSSTGREPVDYGKDDVPF